jgi:hypothetical protein
MTHNDAAFDDSPAVDFYNTGYEESRLDHGIAQLERIRTQQLLAAALPAALLTDFDIRWNDPAQRSTMLMLAESLGTEQSLLGVSAHLLAIAFAPPVSVST